MNFSLIICTYQRPRSVHRLLESVRSQTCYPHQILVIDSSFDERTKLICRVHSIDNLEYFKVEEKERGLTKQRNFGVKQVAEDIEVVFFLDDDTILSPWYFEEILKTYKENPGAMGVSGYITNEQEWKKVQGNYNPQKNEFTYDSWVRVEGKRFSLRRKFGLAPDVPPGYMPDFSHGYSTGFLPPSGKTYEVEMMMGGIASYKKEVFDSLSFSSYFEGYGLYEDADFSLRVSKMGKLYVNTAATVEHHHAPEGRPNMYLYGKMVVRNGWYVWRVKNPKPTFKARLKWHITSFLLTAVRLMNALKPKGQKEAFKEATGRFAGWLSLFLRKPRFSK